MQEGCAMILFVYGTLMKANRAGPVYLSQASYLGPGTLMDYALYDLGGFPGIVKSNEVRGFPRDRVKGELYDISALDIKDIDRYESEGSLYLRKTLEVQDESENILAAESYVYNGCVERHAKIFHEFLPWRPGIGGELKSKYVWYAAYGSNLSADRFQEYIGKCFDTSWPIREMAYTIPHPIYFANASGRWHGKGVAFLDTDMPGRSYGKIYLLTREQLAKVHALEGSGTNWYNALVRIGKKDGLDIMIVTHKPGRLTENPPSKAYLDIIGKGIAETYPHLSEKAIADYLKKAINHHQ